MFRHVREANPEARTVLITGYQAETEPMVERLRAEGADATCYKPFDIPKLLGDFGGTGRSMRDRTAIRIEWK